MHWLLTVVFFILAVSYLLPLIVWIPWSHVKKRKK
jgi:hypothetical protein